MDMLRAAATYIAARAARSRPRPTWWSVVLPFRDSENDERGQGLAEYALILALIAIVAIASLMFLGGTIDGVFSAIINAGFSQVTDLLGI
jgi:pilus assembly protein Flp/PilA